MFIFTSLKMRSYLQRHVDQFQTILIKFGFYLFCLWPEWYTLVICILPECIKVSWDSIRLKNVVMIWANKYTYSSKMLSNIPYKATFTLKIFLIILSQLFFSVILFIFHHRKLKWFCWSLSTFLKCVVIKKQNIIWDALK